MDFTVLAHSATYRDHCFQGNFRFPEAYWSRYGGEDYATLLLFVSTRRLLDQPFAFETNYQVARKQQE